MGYIFLTYVLPLILIFIHYGVIKNLLIDKGGRSCFDYQPYSLSRIWWILICLGYLIPLVNILQFGVFLIILIVGVQSLDVKFVSKEPTSKFGKCWYKLIDWFKKGI